jgi:hypothetical protein
MPLVEKGKYLVREFDFYEFEKLVEWMRSESVEGWYDRSTLRIARETLRVVQAREALVNREYSWDDDPGGFYNQTVREGYHRWQQARKEEEEKAQTKKLTATEWAKHYATKEEEKARKDLAKQGKKLVQAKKMRKITSHFKVVVKKKKAGKK